MRPRERRETGEQELFRSRLDQIIDMNHALVELARAIDWHFLEETFGAVSATTIPRASFTNAWFISMIWSSRERNSSCSPVSRRSRGRIANLPLHQLEREESRLAIRENLKIEFARKSPPKAQKPANSIT